MNIMLSPTDVRVGNWVLKIMGVDKKKDSFFEYQAIALDEYYYTFSSVCFPIPLSAGATVALSTNLVIGTSQLVRKV
jgi:hypothetical protein